MGSRGRSWMLFVFALLLGVWILLFPRWRLSPAFYIFGNTAQLFSLILLTFALSSHGGGLSSNPSPGRRGWRRLAFGFFIWILAFCLDWYCEMVLLVVPYGTASDLFWVFGYLIILFGFQTLVRVRIREDDFHLSRRSLALFLLTSCILYTYLFSQWIFPQLQEPEERIAPKLLDFLYPTFDFLITAAAAFLLLANPGRAWSLITLGALLTTTADLILSASPDVASISYVSVDVFYFSSYFLMAMGINSLQDISPSVRHVRNERTLIE